MRAVNASTSCTYIVIIILAAKYFDTASEAEGLEKDRLIRLQYNMLVFASIHLQNTSPPQLSCI